MLLTFGTSTTTFGTVGGTGGQGREAGGMGAHHQVFIEIQKCKMFSHKCKQLNMARMPGGLLNMVLEAP